MTSTIKVNNIQNQCGANIINESSNTITLGASGDTIALASGASQSGFGRTGTVDWQTTVKTTAFTATSGEGYFCNTTSAAFTVTLPSSPAALDIVAFKDYGLTFDTNNLTIDPGSNKIEGDTTDMIVAVEGRSLTLVYLDSTQGWKVVNDGNSSAGNQKLYVTATGGTVTTCGNFKIHTFTGPGTFTVSCAGNSGGSNTVDYLVVAGGGGGGADRGGGGGAGGYRESSGTASGCYTASPLGACVSALAVPAQSYPITVGGGGAGGTQPAPSSPSGVNGSNSIFSSITSAGGGGGKNSNTGSAGSGGSGGGTSGSAPGARGSGNTPPVTPPQGQNGGLGQDGSPFATGAGGGGAGAAGGDASAPSGASPPGGAGVTSSITGSAVGRAGGGGSTGKSPDQTGGGGGQPSGNTAFGAGAGGNSGTNPGTDNTGGGGGASNNSAAGNGGSGIVVIRYKFQGS